MGYVRKMKNGLSYRNGNRVIVFSQLNGAPPRNVQIGDFTISHRFKLTDIKRDMCRDEQTYLYISALHEKFGEVSDEKSFWTNKSRGSAILIGPNFNPKILSEERDMEGRYVLLKVLFVGDERLNLACVYLPDVPGERVDFISSFSQKLIIFCY